MEKGKDDYWNGKYPTRPVAYYQIPLVGDITTEAMRKTIV